MRFPLLLPTARSIVARASVAPQFTRNILFELLGDIGARAAACFEDNVLPSERQRHYVLVREPDALPSTINACALGQDFGWAVRQANPNVMPDRNHKNDHSESTMCAGRIAQSPHVASEAGARLSRTSVRI